MPGRKPKPTALKVLEGNPGKRKLPENEPDPGRKMPSCPSWLLPEAKAEWKRLAKTLNQMGVLSEADRAAFAAYCQSWARWKEAQEHIDLEGSTFMGENGPRKSPWVAIANEAQAKMMSAASEFGMTPSSRTKIAAANEKGDSHDEMEALLA